MENFTDYQIIMPTHDRMFFELLNTKPKDLSRTIGLILKMHELEKNGIPVPFITESDSYLEKAKTYFHRHEYEITFCENRQRLSVKAFFQKGSNSRPICLRANWTISSNKA